VKAVFRFLLFCYLFLAALSSNWSGALAQDASIAAPPNPVWTTTTLSGPKNGPTPDAACRIQHAAFNPGAPYFPPVRLGDNLYECQWISAQWPGGAGNTILPTIVNGFCTSGFKMRNGLCFDPKAENADCDCPNNDGAPLAPAAPLVGDPINVLSGHQIETETDYATTDGRFKVNRRYSSNRRQLISEGQFGFGSSWQGLIPGRLYLAGINADTVEYDKGNGSGANAFYVPGPSNLNSWAYAPLSMTSLRLTMEAPPAVDRPAFLAGAAVVNGPAEFRLSKDNGDHILFRRAGPTIGPGRYAVPIEQGTANGYRIFYDYPDADYYPHLIRDTDGRQMSLTWKAAPLPDMVGRYPENTYKVIEKIVLPDTTELHYNYDAANTVFSGAYNSTNFIVTAITVKGASDRLISVRRKTAAGTVLWGRDYMYENSRFPYALTGIKDVAGNRLNTFVYDQAGMVASSEMASGVYRHELQTLVYDTNHMFHDVKNPLGRTERYVSWRNPNNGHSDSPRVLDRVEGSATSTVPADVKRFEYQLSGSATLDHTLSATVDRNGVRTDIGIDWSARRPNSITDATGRAEARQTNITYWPNSNLPASIIRGTLKTEYTYTAGGQMLTETQTDLSVQAVPYATGGQTRTTSYAWHANGRLSSINGPLPVNAQGKDDTATFAYDAFGNLLSVTNGLGHITSFSDYDLNGRPQQSTDANNIITRFGYDPLGRLMSMNVKHPTMPANDAITTFTYDAEGRVTGITRPATDAMLMDYNLAGQLTAIRAASGERIDFAYNTAGGVTSQTVKRADASTSRSITRSFDSLNRMLTETLGAGRTTTWAYDKEGNPTQVISARNNATQLAFDGLNRLLTTTHPGGGNEGLTYTALDDLASSTDAISVTTNFVRNGFGEVIQEVSPDRGTSVYYYDAAGRVSAVIDGRGQRIDYTRDILGRVLSKTPIGRPASEVVSYVWDSTAITGSYNIGRLASITDNSNSITRFKYDHRGNLLVKQQKLGTTTAANLTYSYDLSDRIVQIIYPSGRHVGYVRDSKGRVATVRTKATAATTTWTNVATGIQYEPFASLKQATLGNALTMANSWGNDGRLASRRLYVTSSGVNRSLLSYAYDNDDNITGITDGVTPANSMGLGYDVRGRLAQTLWQSGSFAREDILHDANGNRTAVERRIGANDNIAAQTDSYTRTAGTSKLSSITGTFGVRSILYDVRGNTQSESRSGGIAVSTAYDGHGRLISYARTGDASQTNGYNGMDERVVVTSGTVTRRFVYDPDGRVLGEYGTSATNVIAERIWLNPETNDAGMFGGDDGTGGYAPIAVVIGSTLRWVHANHMGVPQLHTSNTGAIIATPAYTLPGFPGQFRTYADLYYNKYRDYDTTTGRYIQADPIGLNGDVNPYLYALGNPLSYTDPTGEIAWWIPAAVLGGGNLAYQYFWEGKDLECIDWWEAADWALSGLPMGRLKPPTGFNPFKGKSPKQIERILLEKGYKPMGPDPLRGRGNFVSPRTGPRTGNRPYHIDANHPPPKPPHVGVGRPRGDARDNFPTRDFDL
jgi:RHS repeat-associated protein